TLSLPLSLSLSLCVSGHSYTTWASSHLQCSAVSSSTHSFSVLCCESLSFSLTFPSPSLSLSLSLSGLHCSSSDSVELDPSAVLLYRDTCERKPSLLPGTHTHTHTCVHTVTHTHTHTHTHTQS